MFLCLPSLNFLFFNFSFLFLNSINFDIFCVITPDMSTNWLCLIHSETHHPWDWLFQACGLGTAADHHVHHKLFCYNYGHLFSYWDRACGTYRHPQNVRQFRKNEKAPTPWKPRAHKTTSKLALKHNFHTRHFGQAKQNGVAQHDQSGISISD